MLMDIGFSVGLTTTIYTLLAMENFLFSSLCGGLMSVFLYWPYSARITFSY